MFLHRLDSIAWEGIYGSSGWKQPSWQAGLNSAVLSTEQMC